MQEELKKYMIRVMAGLINEPSLPRDCENAFGVLEGYVKELGYELTRDNRGNRYMTIEGEDTSKTVMIASHMDTIGLIVRRICPDGTLKVAALGGPNPHSLEHESVTVHTRGGGKVSGFVACDAHSVHSFVPEGMVMQRDEKTLHVRLNERADNAAQVAALGIEPGDYISTEPHFTVYDSGYVRSRFIDDKACVACVLAMAKTLRETGRKPKYNVVCAFTAGEEVFQSGYVPQGVSEYIAVDIGLLSPDLNGTEYDVSIIALDKLGPYDKRLIERLIGLSKSNGIGYKVDVYSPRIMSYGTDASAAQAAGWDINFAAIGPGTLCTHGIERTHMDALDNTIRLLTAYALDK